MADSQVIDFSVWQSRIVGHAVVDPRTLIPHPDNFRIHVRKQQRAVGASLEDLGWIDDVKVNTRTGHVLNGHLRIELAIANEQLVPVTYLDLDEKEEPMALATFDAIASMAVPDNEQLDAILAEERRNAESIRLLAEMDAYGVFAAIDWKAAIPKIDEDIDTGAELGDGGEGGEGGEEGGDEDEAADEVDQALQNIEPPTRKHAYVIYFAADTRRQFEATIAALTGGQWPRTAEPYVKIPAARFTHILLAGEKPAPVVSESPDPF